MRPKRIAWDPVLLGYVLALLAVGAAAVWATRGTPTHFPWLAPPFSGVMVGLVVRPDTNVVKVLGGASLGWAACFFFPEVELLQVPLVALCFGSMYYAVALVGAVVGLAGRGIRQGIREASDRAS